MLIKCAKRSTINRLRAAVDFITGLNKIRFIPLIIQIKWREDQELDVLALLMTMRPRRPTFKINKFLQPPDEEKAMSWKEPAAGSQKLEA